MKRRIHGVAFAPSSVLFAPTAPTARTAPTVALLVCVCVAGCSAGEAGGAEAASHGSVAADNGGPQDAGDQSAAQGNADGGARAGRWGSSRNVLAGSSFVQAPSGSGDAGAGDGADLGAGGNAGGDAGSEGGVLALPVSTRCGDAIRDPVLEECDNGAALGDSTSLCSADCHVVDQLSVDDAPAGGGGGGQGGQGGPPRGSRNVGTGRHPVAGGAQNMAVAWVEPGTSDVATHRVRVGYYDQGGAPLSGAAAGAAGFDVLSAGLASSSFAAPSLAELGNGTFGAVYTDFGTDGDGLGVRLVLLDPARPVVQALSPVTVNQTTVSSQMDADVVWTGGNLVVAWTDLSNPATSPDVRFQLYDAALNPLAPGVDQVLAATDALEGDVSLAAFAGSWAAAWREQTATSEIVRVQAGGSTWSTPAFTPTLAHQPPALAQLDATHLLLVFTWGNADGSSVVRAAILSTDAPGEIIPVDITLAGQAGRSTFRPSAVVVGASGAGGNGANGTSAFVTWGMGALAGDPLAEELYLKELLWDGAALDVSRSSTPLPRSAAHQVGDQRFAALATVTQVAGPALACVWDDLGTAYASEGHGDVAVELIPVPVVRLP